MANLKKSSNLILTAHSVDGNNSTVKGNRTNDNKKDNKINFTAIRNMKESVVEKL